MVTIALTLLPPIVDQPLTSSPLTFLSAAAFLAVACLALFLALRRPQWAMALLAFAIPFAFYRDIGGTTLTLEKVIIVGIAIGLLLRRAPLVPKSTSARRILIAGLAVLGAIVISGIQATYMGPVAREALKMIEYLVMFWCAASLMIESGNDTRGLEGGVIAATVIVVLDALSQATFGGAPSGVWVNGHPLPRVAGPLEGPNQLAGYLEAVLPLLILSPMILGREMTALRWGAIAATMAALVLSQSRAGIAVAILGYGLIWLIDRRAARSALAPFLIGTAAGIGVAVAWYWGATQNLSEVLTYLLRLVVPHNPGGVGTRNELWGAALTLFAQHPLIGVGAGNFEFLLGSVGLPNVQTHANSLWLQTLAEQGVVGLAALAALVIVAVRECAVGMTRSWIIQVALVATVCLFLHQVFDDLVFFPKIGLLWWLLLGAAAGATALSPVGAQAAAAVAKPELREHPTPVS